VLRQLQQSVSQLSSFMPHHVHHNIFSTNRTPSELITSTHGPITCMGGRSQDIRHLGSAPNMYKLTLERNENSHALLFQAVSGGQSCPKLHKIKSRKPNVHIVRYSYNAQTDTISLYRLDACPINVVQSTLPTSDHSLDFMQTQLPMKLLNTGSVDIVPEYCFMFNIRLVS